MQVFLIGYRATGKSSVGRELAQGLDLPFYDTDELIVSRIGRTIKAFVAEKGWEAFRQEEKQVIREIASSENVVVALGGGAILNPENRERIRKGWVVWLTAGRETILKRMSADPLNKENRPSLSEKNGGEEIQEILDERIPLYRQISDLQVDTEGKTIEAVTVEILGKMKLHNPEKM